EREKSGSASAFEYRGRRKRRILVGGKSLAPQRRGSRTRAGAWKKSPPLPWRSRDPALSSTSEVGLRRPLESLPGSDFAMRAAGSPGKPGRPSSLPRAGGWQGSPAPFVSRGNVTVRSLGRFARRERRPSREGDRAQGTSLESEDLDAQSVAVEHEEAR